MSGSRIRISVLAVLLVAAAAIPLNAATVSDTFSETWSVDPGGSLNLSNENGSVQVGSWDRSEVRVRAEIKLKAGSSRSAREAMEQFRIRTSRDGDEITVSSRKPRGADGFLSWLAGKNIEVDVNYEVMVPSQFDVEIETVNGKISAESLSGLLELGSVNGGIEVRNARGSVSADTVNGSIEVELVDVAGSGSMNFGTTNGRITLSLPSSVQASVDAATTNGSISSEMPVTSESITRSRFKGTINGGGLPIRMRTVNGSIRIATSS